MIHDRRTILKALGGAAALPLVPWFLARADGAPAPARFVAFFSANGRIPETWASGGETTFTLGESLAPLEPFRDRLLLLDEVDMNCAYVGPGGGHQKGVGAWLTGRELQEGTFFVGGTGRETAGFANGVSVDQHIARQIGRTTAFESLALGVQIEGQNNRHRISFAAPGEPVVPEDDPYALFELVFAPLVGSPAELARRQRRRQSVLDHVRGSLKRVQGQLRAEDRQQLDAHLTSLREVEQRFSRGPSDSAACRMPALEPGLDVHDPALYGEIGRLQMDLLHLALACDLTRVASLLWGGATSCQRFVFMDPPLSAPHHDLSHAPDDDQDARRQLTRIDAWYADQLAYLLGKLASTREGDGTLLDQTILFWGSDVATGNTHSRLGNRFVLAGNVARQWRTGRYLHCDGAEHNQLLVSLCRAFGLDDTTFGNPEFNDGELDGLTG